jgi:hypothetical protein
VRGLATAGKGALATRVSPEKAEHVLAAVAGATYDPVARLIVVPAAVAAPAVGRIAIVCAGTSDLPVAEEAAQTAAFLGAEVVRLVDVGVAGLHRLLARIDVICVRRRADHRRHGGRAAVGGRRAGRRAAVRGADQRRLRRRAPAGWWRWRRCCRRARPGSRWSTSTTASARRWRRCGRRGAGPGARRAR